MAELSERIVEQEQHEIWDRIQKAVAEERERCAKVAETWNTTSLYAPEKEGRHPIDAGYRMAREGIAEEIRRG